MIRGCPVGCGGVIDTKNAKHTIEVDNKMWYLCVPCTPRAFNFTGTVQLTCGMTFRIVGPKDA